jgi:diadenosine tetraphosphate (Ap4A) HIT family hydrolase
MSQLTSGSHFSPFIRGEKPAFVIAETDQFMAVIEEKPLKEGHCVVFPKAVKIGRAHV